MIHSILVEIGVLIGVGVVIHLDLVLDFLIGFGVLIDSVLHGEVMIDLQLVMVTFRMHHFLLELISIKFIFNFVTMLKIIYTDMI
jgi:hypothetical protein